MRTGFPPNSCTLPVPYDPQMNALKYFVVSDSPRREAVAKSSTASLDPFTAGHFASCSSEVSCCHYIVAFTLLLRLFEGGRFNFVLRMYLLVWRSNFLGVRYECIAKIRTNTYAWSGTRSAP